MADPVLDIVAIKQAIVDALLAAGIEQVYPCWYDNIEPPCVVVIGIADGYVDLDTKTYRLGTVGLNVTLAMFGQAETIEGQQQIDRWLSIGGSEPSVIDALRPFASGVPDNSLGLPGVSFLFGTSRFSPSVNYPAGSNTRYAMGELDLAITISTGG